MSAHLRSVVMSALAAAFALSLTAVSAGCSTNKHDASSSGELSYDTGTASPVERDSQPPPIDSGTVVVDGSAEDANIADLGTKDGGTPALCPSEFGSGDAVSV